MRNALLEKLDRAVNSRLERIFGVLPSGDRKVWMHSQCLNEDSRRLRKMGLTEASFPVHGRAFLHWYGTLHGGPRNNSAEFCWDLLGDRLSIGLTTAYCEHHLTGHVCIPPFGFWLSIESDWAHAIHSWISDRNKEPGRQYGPSHFEIIGFRIHDDTVWFDLWHDADCWSSKDAKWKRIHVNVPDFLFGRHKHAERTLEEHDVLIPMPEGGYPAHVKVSQATWKRPRWPKPIIRTTYNIEMKIPIPHQGKGENSWDCGEDAAYGFSCCADSLEHAISKLTMSVLNDRKKYDGNMMAKYPAPKECHQVCEACKAGKHDDCDRKDGQCRCVLKKPKSNGSAYMGVVTTSG
jgi:hypothetical protein